MKRPYFILVTVLVVTILSCNLFTGSDESIAVPKIGVVFPTNGDRWKDSDGPGLKAQFDTAQIASLVLYAENTVSTELEQVNMVISADCTILVLCPVDRVNSEPAIAVAKQAGLTVILYDRLMAGNTAADYYVSFNNFKIGEAQGEFLVDALGEESDKSLFLYTGAENDQNSQYFLAGSWKYIQPKIADGSFVVKNSVKAVEYQTVTSLSDEQILEIINETTTGWNTTVTNTLVASNISDSPPTTIEPIFILSPNDYFARIIGDKFREAGVIGMNITGQDGEPDSLQYIIDGKQSMTIMKWVESVYETAAPFALKIANGEDPGLVSTVNNGTIDLPFCEVPFVEVLSIEDINVLITGGILEDTFTWGL